MKNEKRINIRLTPEKFDSLNDARFAARTSWQELILTLLDGWASGRQNGASSGQSPVAAQPVESRPGPAFGIPRAEWHRMLDRVLDSPFFDAMTDEERELLEAAAYALQHAGSTTANAVKGQLEGVLGEYRKWKKGQQEAPRKRHDHQRRQTGT
jgi:hypothetical protein